LSLPDTTVLCYADGFFHLRHELEPHLEFVSPEGKPKDGCGVPPNVVVYVPIERAQTSHALIEAETAGVVVEPGAAELERNSRLRVQTEAYFLEVAPEKAAQHADDGNGNLRHAGGAQGDCPIPRDTLPKAPANGVQKDHGDAGPV
jgi:hypothetical protein